MPRFNKKSNIKGQTQTLSVSLDDGDDEGLAALMPEMQRTVILVNIAVRKQLQAANAVDNSTAGNPMDMDLDADGCVPMQRNTLRTVEHRYIDLMKKLQFGRLL